MDRFDDVWAAQQRRYRMRPDAHRYIRHDAWRFMPPGSPRYVGRDVVKYFEPASSRSERKGNEPNPEAEREELLTLKREIVALKAEIKFRKFLRALKAYNPNQLRVPAGNPDGGQWTGEGEGASGKDRVRLAAGDKPALGPKAAVKIALEVAKKVLETLRSKESLWDLFGEPVGAVTYTEIDGKIVYGSNSSLPLYQSADRAERDRMIDRFVAEHPDMEEIARARRMPIDAFSHAETNVLLRAARDNGGTLEGRTLQVFGDRMLCNNCEKILPFVGQKLGNPTVTFFDSRGEAGTIRDGVFHKARAR